MKIEIIKKFLTFFLPSIFSIVPTKHHSRSFIHSFILCFQANVNFTLFGFCPILRSFLFFFFYLFSFFFLFGKFFHFLNFLPEIDSRFPLRRPSPPAAVDSPTASPSRLVIFHFGFCSLKFSSNLVKLG